MINEMVVRGLVDCGERKLAAELALKTIYAFNHNCTEFINPFDGSGHGVKQYAWTASQYLELIVETIFGIHYCSNEKMIRVDPIITEKMKNEYIALKGLCISDGICLDIEINRGDITCQLSSDSIKVAIANQ